MQMKRCSLPRLKEANLGGGEGHGNSAWMLVFVETVKFSSQAREACLTV